MKKVLIYSCNIFLFVQIATANREIPVKNLTAPVRYAKAPLRFKTYSSYLQYVSIKAFKGIDSANAFYRKELENAAYNYTDYLPLTAGSSYPLTGTLIGTEASFSGSIGIGTTSPGSELQLYGKNSATTNGIILGRGNDDYNQITHIYTLGGGDGFVIENRDLARVLSSGVDVFFRNTGSNGTRTNMTIQGATGNVGIGTTSPGAKLDVYGLLNVTRSDEGHYLQFGSEGGVGKISARNPTSAGYATLNISQWNNTTERVVAAIDANGNVGIGTTSPGSKLDVNGNANIDGAVYAHSSETNTIAPSGGSISFHGAYSSIRVGTDHSWNIDVYNSGSPLNAFKVAQNGNVGIGTTTSLSEKLSVNGNISTKKLIVTQTGWSDYVFNKDYKLRTLQSLEAYINQNKHLPEVPTSKEVEAKGISVGDNQALLLKKIEELTLYVINLQKQITNQAKEIHQLKNKK